VNINKDFYFHINEQKKIVNSYIKIKGKLLIDCYKFSNDFFVILYTFIMNFINYL
jgi:hypothetical protein